MSSTAADNLCERLVEWGIDTVYGFPGDGTDPRLVILVLNNEDVNQVTWEQRVMEGNPRFAASQDIPYVPVHEYAGLIGLKGIRIDRSADIDGAVGEAFASDRPVILDAITDPEEAPLPPHITFKQAEGFAPSVLQDARDGIPGAIEAAREKLDEFLPNR